VPASDDATTDGSTDDELRAIIVGDLRQHNAPIVLSDYDPRWPALFARERDRIRGALGATAVAVEHVGSTSVPGLAAKPIIDILLVVPDSSDEARYLPELESRGYALRIREPEWFQHRLLKGPDTDVNVHVFSVGATECRQMTGFRDRLRADAADRDYYQAAKRALARRTWRHVQHYADAKTAVIREIMTRASACHDTPDLER